jgi:hypothetical protein
MDEEDENVAHAASYQIQKTQKFEPTEQFARDSFNLSITRMNLTNILNTWVTRAADSCVRPNTLALLPAKERLIHVLHQRAEAGSTGEFQQCASTIFNSRSRSARTVCWQWWNT